MRENLSFVILNFEQEPELESSLTGIMRDIATVAPYASQKVISVETQKKVVRHMPEALHTLQYAVLPAPYGSFTKDETLRIMHRALLCLVLGVCGVEPLVTDDVHDGIVHVFEDGDSLTRLCDITIDGAHAYDSQFVSLVSSRVKKAAPAIEGAVACAKKDGGTTQSSPKWLLPTILDELIILFRMYEAYEASDVPTETVKMGCYEASILLASIINDPSPTYL